MREIKFRGKRVDNGEWVYGSLINYKNEDYWNKFFIKEDFDRFTFNEMPNVKNIYSILCVEVIPETVGQFTGLLDKNGKEIYEGDIVQVTLNGKPITIEFKYEMDYTTYKHALNGELIKVIGNIYDNKNLSKYKGEQNE